MKVEKLEYPPFSQIADVYVAMEHMDGFTKGMEYLGVEYDNWDADGIDRPTISFFANDHGREGPVRTSWRQKFKLIESSQEDRDAFYEIEMAAAPCDHPFIQE